MAESFPRIYADDRAVRRENKLGQPSGIDWDEIVGIGGYKPDGITEVHTIVELDFEYGEWLELPAQETGFPEVVRAMAA